MSQRTYNVLRIALFSSLVVWGLYSLIVYLASPVHQAVLLSDAGRQAVANGCPGGGTICQGLTAIVPFVAFSIGRAGYFLWYAIWSAVLFGGLLFMGYARTGEWRLKFTLTPLALIVGFLVSLWLIFTTLSAGMNEGTPYTRIFEPTAQVYVSADAESLDALKENFDALQARGCLREAGVTTGGARAYDIHHRCIQGSFFTRVLPQAFFVLYLLFIFLVLGRALLRLLRMPEWHPLAELIFSLGLGSCGMIVLLWLMALIGVYNAYVGWGLMLLLPVLLFKDSLYWLQSSVRRKWTYDAPAYAGALVLGWLLVSYLALNFLNVIRPFPIGWDDLGKYINQPRLLVSYGHFIPQLGAFMWEYVTSLGFLLFGYGDVFQGQVFGATLSMLINWAAGLLAVLSVYAFGRLYLGPQRGLLAALLYYALPMVGHFSFADMKVDNAVFFMGTLAALAAFRGFFPAVSTGDEHLEDEAEEEGKDEADPAGIDWRWMLLAGILGGFAFAIKPTAIMGLFGLGTILFGVAVHWTAFVGTMSIAWVLYAYEGRLNIADIANRVYGSAEALSAPVIIGALAVLGVGLLGYAMFLRPAAFKRTLLLAGVFIGGFIVAVAPWLLMNNIGYGNVIPRLVFTAPNDITPAFVIGDAEIVDHGQDIRRLPKELQVDTSRCFGTAKTEELDRYWGYRSGWTHYLSLPWRTIMNVDSGGYYVTTFPALLLFPLVLLLPFFWMKRGKWLRWMVIMTAFAIVQWMLFANGIIWYGLGMFLGLVLALEALVMRAPDIPSKIASSLLIALSLLMAFGNRFWQFEQQRNLFEYPLGKVSAHVLTERTIPYYDDILESIEQRRAAMPDRPYTFRIGTFIPYFIPRNLEVLPVADHQLDMFNCLYQEQDPALTLKRLQMLGFNSIIFDTNTHTIERDENGTLHQKVQKFVDFVNTPGLGITVPVNSPDSGIAYILLP